MSSSSGLNRRGSNAKEAEPAAAAPSAAAKDSDVERARYAAMIVALADKAPEKLRPYIEQAAPHVATAIVLAQQTFPYVVKVIRAMQDLLSRLPEEALVSFFGFCACFFGGVFPATIAAVEAWQLCGGREALQHVKQLWKEAEKVKEAHREDGQRDENNDGVLDVRQMDPKALLWRKWIVTMKAMNPSNINDSVVGLYTGWVGMLAVLKIRFAKTVTLGDAIGSRLYGMVSHTESALKSAWPEEIQQWLPVIVRWTCKLAAISTAWWLSRITSAFHSSMRGGFVCAESLIKLLKKRQGVDVEAYGTYAGDTVGWAIATLGLLFQFTFRFGVPFPLSMFTWPLSIIEALIIWSVSGNLPF